MQCQRCPENGRPLKLSAIQTGRKLIAEEGPLRLFRGVSTMLSASLPAHAVYFSVFEAMKKSLGADSAEHTPVASGMLLLLSGSIRQFINNNVLLVQRDTTTWCCYYCRCRWCRRHCLSRHNHDANGRTCCIISLD